MMADGRRDQYFTGRQDESWRHGLIHWSGAGNLACLLFGGFEYLRNHVQL